MVVVVVMVVEVEVEELLPLPPLLLLPLPPLLLLPLPPLLLLLLLLRLLLRLLRFTCFRSTGSRPALRRARRHRPVSPRLRFLPPRLTPDASPLSSTPSARRSARCARCSATASMLSPR